jgi:hypothetical protein
MVVVTVTHSAGAMGFFFVASVNASLKYQLFC